MANYTPYERSVRNAFTTAWRFFEAHKNARKPSDITAAADALDGVQGGLSARLVAVVCDEIAREYEDALRGDDT